MKENNEKLPFNEWLKCSAKNINKIEDSSVVVHAYRKRGEHDPYFRYRISVFFRGSCFEYNKNEMMHGNSSHYRTQQFMILKPAENIK